MHIIVSNDSELPIYAQIKEQIRDQILSGELIENEMLPSLRQLAKELQVSVLTTTRAYNELEQEGFVISRQGKGFFVISNGALLIKEQLTKELEKTLRSAITVGEHAQLSQKEIVNLLMNCFNNMEEKAMASNAKNIYEHYGSGVNEDDRAISSRSQSLEFYFTEKTMEKFIMPDSCILEIGCATGYYAERFSDKCKQYIGVDIHSPHIEIFKKKIVDKNWGNVSCQIGDAVHLSGFSDDSFDVVLCLGPMYHLPPQEREQAFSECVRVCKPKGIVAFAYINKIGLYIGGCVHDDLREHYPNKAANELVLKQGVDDVRPNTFFFTMPEEIESVAERHGLTKIKNIGTDYFVTMSVVDKMDDEKFALYMELAEEMAKYESCTGMSNHALLVCQKNPY